MKQVNIKINGENVCVNEGKTLLEAAGENGVFIPTLCHDERLEPYGSCWLCVSKMEGSPKLFPACALKVTEGGDYLTETQDLKNLRKLGLELLLSDHFGDCIGPCQMNCPANCDVQGYVAAIANGDYRQAVKIMKETLVLTSSLGRVCPHPCEEHCRRQFVEESISIRNLKRYASDLDLLSKDPYLPEKNQDTGKKIAVVGAGPAGLSCAYYSAIKGHKVTIFEAMDKAGGMLYYGIPQYRLPKDILQKEVDLILKLGIEINYNKRLGTDFTISELQEKFDAVFLGLGAWKAQGMRVPGEDTHGVYTGIDFLKQVAQGKSPQIGPRVVVVGGGNTAIDSARTALRLDGVNEVIIVYRRSRDEMPAENIEIIEAEKEGVKLYLLQNPVKVIAENGKVNAVECIKMELGAPDESGRRRPVPVDGSNFVLQADTVIAAIGQVGSLNCLNASGVEVTKWQTISANEETYCTNVEGVFAGGDVLSGAATAVKAIGAGRKAAHSIDYFLKYGKPEGAIKHYNHVKEVSKEDFKDEPLIEREPMPELEPIEREKNFKEVEIGFSSPNAQQESMRCLSCGCKDVFNCKLKELASLYGAKQDRITGENHKFVISEYHPYIERDQNKCIKCGRCVRICYEVQGAKALSFAKRGFNAVITPAFDEKLVETTCESCGQCVSTCPTGSLTYRINLPKQGPFVGKHAKSICAYCGTGCNLEVNLAGKNFLEITSKDLDTLNQGNLCVKGRFGYGYLNSDERLISPLLKTEGKLKEISFEKTLETTVSELKKIKEKYGSSSLAFVSGLRNTIEEHYLMQMIARVGFDCPNILSFGTKNYGVLEESLGNSDFDYNLIESARTIVVLGSDIKTENPIIALKIKKAVTKGAQLLEIGTGFTKLSEDSILSFGEKENLKGYVMGLLSSIIKEKDVVDINGFEKLKSMVLQIKNSPPEISAIHSIVDCSENVILIANADTISPDILSLIYNLKLLIGEKAKVLFTRAKNNSLGAILAGVTPFYLPGLKKAEKTGILASDLLENIKKGTIKGMFVLGEDPVGCVSNPEMIEVFSKLEFLAVMDIFMSDTAKIADVVIPASTFIETSGNYINSECITQKIKKLIKPLAGNENWQILNEFMKQLSMKTYNNIDEISTEILQISTTKETFRKGFIFAGENRAVEIEFSGDFLEKRANEECQKTGIKV